MIGGISYAPILYRNQMLRQLQQIREQQRIMNPTFIDIFGNDFLLKDLSDYSQHLLTSNEIIQNEYVPQFDLDLRSTPKKVDPKTIFHPSKPIDSTTNTSTNTSTNISNINSSLFAKLGESLTGKQAENYKIWTDIWKKWGHLVGIKDNAAYCYLLAQLNTESGNFSATSENLNYSVEGLLTTFPKYFNKAQAQAYAGNPEKIANRVYANRLGNGSEASGDGYKYRGRGFIQLTGKSNYKNVYDNFFIPNGLGEYDIVNNPELGDDPTVGALMSIGWLSLNKNAVHAANRHDVNALTKHINGGTNGLSTRKSQTNTLLSKLKEFEEWQKSKKQFTLDDFAYSDRAKSLNIDNSIPEDYKPNVQQSLEFLQQLQDAWGSEIRLTSGYRSEELNNKLHGSSKTSAHMSGYAMDIQPVNGDWTGFVKFIKDYMKDKDYDQTIIETGPNNSRWVHIGLFNKDGEQRKQTFNMNV